MYVQWKLYTQTYVHMHICTHTFEPLNKGHKGENINLATSVLCREFILFEDLKHITRTNSEEIVLD